MSDDRRRHPRVPVQIDVAYDNDVFLVNATLRDLSIGGAHILTEAPLPVGTRLALTFRGNDSPIDLTARVLRVTEEDPDDPQSVPGMAVQFTEVSVGEETALENLIASYLAQPAGAEETAEEPAPEAPAEHLNGAAPENHLSEIAAGDVAAGPNPAEHESLVDVPTEIPESLVDVPTEVPTDQELITTARIDPVEEHALEDDGIRTIRMEPPSEAQDLEHTLAEPSPLETPTELEMPVVQAEASEPAPEKRKRGKKKR